MPPALTAAVFGQFRPILASSPSADAPGSIAAPPSKDAKAVPMGCELLVRNITVTGSATAKETLQAAHDAIYHQQVKAHGPGALFPMVAHAVGRNGDNQSVTRSAILRMSTQTGIIFDEPRYDLVQAWMDPLRAAHPDWEVLPAPMSFGRDKRCILTIHDALDPAKLLVEVKDVLTTTHGYELVAAYKSTYRNSVVLHFQTPRHVDEVCKLTVRVKSMKQPLRFERSFQIDPRNLLEVGIKGMNLYELSMVGFLRSVLEHGYRREDHPKDVSLIIDCRVEDDYLLVTFRDWPTTARVLNDTETWASYTQNYPKLGRPRLVYEINDMPNEKPAAPRAVELSGTSQTYVDDRFAEVTRRMDAMNANFTLQVKKLADQNALVVDAVREISQAVLQLKYTTHAIDVVSAARDSVNTLMLTATNLRFDLSVAAEADKPRIQAELAQVTELMHEAREELAAAKKSKDSVTPKLTLPAPPPAAVPSTPSHKRPGSPLGPDNTPTSKHHRADSSRPTITPLALTQTPSSTRAGTTTPATRNVRPAT